MMAALRILPALLLVLLCAAGCRAAEPAAVTRQEIEVALAPESSRLTGRTVLTATGPGTLRLRLAPAAEVTAVTVGGRNAEFRRFSEGLTVTLPEQGPTEVGISYAGVFADAISPGGGTEDPSYGVAGAITPAGTYLGGEAAWYPEPEAPPAKRIVTVHAPAGISAVTAGRLVRRGEEPGGAVTVWEVDQPVVSLSLSAGRYGFRERRLGDIAIQSWLLADDRELAERYLTSSAGYVAFYSALLGPYPFPKFAVVENFIPTGYGFPSYTLIGGNVLRLPFITATSLPHEIVHNWWGNGVLADYRHGNWSEGLTTYLADYLQEERKSPQAGRSYRMKILADYATLVPPERDFPLSRFTSRTDAASRTIGYGKGAMAFHTARRIAGDEAFYAGLRQVVRDRLFRRASWDDFAAAFGSEAGAFLREFVETKGEISVSVRDAALRRSGGKWELTGRIVQEPLRSGVPVTLALRKGEREVARETFTVGSVGKAFRMVVAEPPDRLVIDPDADLFRRLAPQEIPFTVNRIKGSRSLTAVRGSLCRADKETLRLLLDSLGQRNAAIFPEDDAIKIAAGSDLLVCGVTRPELLPQLPEGVTAGTDSFTVDGRRFAGPGDLLFAVGSRREGGTAALFLPLAGAEAIDDAPRITHYGSYGHLVFQRGKNVIKGLAPSAEGPGTMRLSETVR